MTTDGAAASGLRARGRRSVSVRTRIAVSVAVLSALALGIAGALVYTLESRNIEADINAKIDQEIAELAALQREGIDPDTGAGFTSVTRLLDTFLVRNVPDDDEMLVGYWGGRSVERTRHRHGDVVVDSASFQTAVEGLLPAGGTEKLQLPEAGFSWVTVQPVQDRTTSGALVVVTFAEEERDELLRVMRTYAAVSLVLLVLIVAAAWFQAGRLLNPLRALRDSTRDITTTDLSRRLTETGNDDITQLTMTFNAMLARLEDGFDSQRQFLDDAGHELRTPLTVLRGHLELVDSKDPDEVAETRALLLDEIDRMARLVGDLILLAKSGRPDFVQQSSTSLTELVTSVHRKATGLAPREWRLGAVPSDDVEVPVDEQRITQALLQLCDNAVKHTNPGDVILLQCTVVGETAEFVVEDAGRGVPAADRERIFARFGRARVKHGDEGFGLGLSIVRAIADAHQGSVHVEDSSAGGARFALRVPMSGRD